MKKLCAIATAVALVLIVGTTSAATSSPATGGWKGHLKGVSPATSVTFIVGTSHGKRTVTVFQSSGSFKAKCPHAGITSVVAVPTATVSSAGRFNAVATLDNGFGTQSWTVSGTFGSKHAAHGTVAIVLALTSVKRCKFSVPWSAKLEPPAHPAHRATYKGKTSAGFPVKIKVSASGRKLASVSWHAPLVGDCPGIGNGSPTITAHNVPVHGSKFNVKLVSGKGTGVTATNTIAGEFLSGRKASGTIATFSIIKSIGRTCVGNGTWTASAG
jgi:hypothetical protein